MEERRICYRCLLKEYDEQKYHETIEEYIEKLGGLRVEEALYQKRLDVCRQCEKLNYGTCLVCGCYVELRAAAKTGTCPRKKWQKKI